MGLKTNRTCKDSQTISKCDVLCDTIGCRAWEAPRPITVEVPEEEYLAMLKMVGAARLLRSEGKGFEKLMGESLDGVDKAQENTQKIQKRADDIAAKLEDKAAKIRRIV